MTLLSICQDASDEIGIAQPTSIIGSTEPDSQKLLRFASKAGQRLVERVNWNILRVFREYTAVATQLQPGILPNNCKRMVPETFWNTTDKYLITGPAGSVRWSGLSANQYQNDVANIFTLVGKELYLIPAPRAGDKLQFEYIKNEWVESETGTPQTGWKSNTDTSLIDEELITYGVIYMFLKAEGLPYADAFQEFKDYYDLTIKNSRQKTDIMVAGDIFSATQGRHFDGQPLDNSTTGDWW